MKLPTSAKVGLIASAGATCLWSVEQLTGVLLFEDLTIPFKFVTVLAPLFFIADLSSMIAGRFKLTIALWLSLVALTLCAMAIFLPWRDGFAHKFNNPCYRWYCSDTNPKHFGSESEFTEWKEGWAKHSPHKIETGLLIGYYALLLGSCAAIRLKRIAGIVLGMAGYALLVFVPRMTGIIDWNYDIFLKGIAFDSISMDLHPFAIWFAGDMSIFFYVFMLIFFSICSLFFWNQSKPRCDVAQANPEAVL